MAVRPTDMFVPDAYDDVRAPAMQAGGLPFYAYTSPEWYQREVDRIFRREWMLACRADEVPEAGDYHYFELLDEPIMIVRGTDGVLRALSASCRHRGTPVVSESGSCKVFHCPYHSWAYALDGTLLGGPPEMHETENFDKSAYGLLELPLAQWGGFVYVNLDRDAEPFEATLGDLPDKLRNYNLDDMRVARRVSYDLECNWKIYVENFMEEYHVATVHLKTIQKTLPMSSWHVEDPHGQYLSLYGKQPGSLALLEGDMGFPEIPSLGDRERQGSYIILTTPSTGFGFTTDCCWWLQMLPTGPERLTLHVGQAFPAAVFDRPGFEETAARYYQRMDTTLAEDNAIAELQQKGVRTKVNYRVGRISYRERLVHDVANYVLDHVLEEPTR